MNDNLGISVASTVTARFKRINMFLSGVSVEKGACEKMTNPRKPEGKQSTFDKNAYRMGWHGAVESSCAAAPCGYAEVNLTNPAI